MTRNAMWKEARYPGNVVTLTTVPKVRLYVERPEQPQHWFVHVGHVTERGRWQTAPHAHPGYGQVIFVRSGRGVMNLEGRGVPFEGPCVLVLPTECVHGLDYQLDADRWVVTVEAAYLAHINGKLHEFVQLWAAPRMVPLSQAPEAATECYNLIRQLEREMGSGAVGHAAGTEALLTFLLLTLVRGASLEQTDGEGATPGEIRLAERFRELIDQHYRDNLPLQDYASMLTVSLAQLRTACAAAAAQSPAKMIHARIIAEAKRNLIFGDTPVEQIAFSLGFSEAAYFTRFFRKEVGQAPSQFRASAQGGN